MIKFNERYGRIEPLVRELIAEAPASDERVIMPAMFNFANLLAGHNFAYGNFPRQTRKQLEDRVRQLNGNLKKFPWGKDKTFDANFYPIVPTQSTLGHGTGMYGRLSGNCIGNKEGLMRGVIGYFEEEKPTYLLDPKIFNPRNASLGGGGYLVRINVKELLKSRTIFYDPEGAFNLRETGKTFLIFGGIPLQAVKEICATEYTS